MEKFAIIDEQNVKEKIMGKFAIITDSSSDLARELRQKYDVDCVSARCFIDGKEYECDPDWENICMDDFYNRLRSGERIQTSQISNVKCVEVFEKYLKDGYDILSISCATALSNGYNITYQAKEELLKKYPERKIVCIDSKNASGGLALLVIKASMLRAEGKTLEETAEWVENNKKFINQEGSVDKLSYLKQAGRVSAAAAFFGGLLNIKPMIISDVHGYNVAVEKVKGRKTSINRAVERVVERYTGEGIPFVIINHTQCEDVALEIKQMIMEKLNLGDDQVIISNVAGAMGASVGPGMFGIYHFGKEVTYDSKAN